MKNTARAADHPVHPMLVPFPIGLFVTSFVFDLIYLGTGTRVFYDVAYYMIIAGIIGALAAAIPGFIDYFTLPLSRTARTRATTHMLLNLSVVVLYIINLFALRYDRGAVAGTPLAIAIILNAISVAALAYSGWLGGHLVYVHGIGVSVEDATRELEMSREAGHGHIAGQLGGERPDDEDRRRGRL